MVQNEGRDKSKDHLDDRATSTSWAVSSRHDASRPARLAPRASARGGSCCGVAGAHRSKVRLWAHARRGRRETLDVPALKKGAIGQGCRTFYPSFEAP